MLKIKLKIKITPFILHTNILFKYHTWPFSSYFFINRLSLVAKVLDLKSRIYFCDLKRYPLSFRSFYLLLLRKSFVK
jgi:hypothetical protein